MTFIVSLAHFCEVHGPSMIMCTQVVNTPENLTNFYSPQLPESQFCQACMFQIPFMPPDTIDSNSTATGSTTNTAGTVSTVNSSSSAFGRSVTNDGNLRSPLLDATNKNQSSKTTLTLEDQISNLLNSSSPLQENKRKSMTLKTKSKRNPNTHFISTQFPTNTDIYSSLRQTIVRVFTAETNADLNKPLMFGNSKHGYSIALIFSLMDKTARGSERKYAIIVTSNWEIDLFNNYTFILTNLNQIVRNILRSARERQREVELSNSEGHNNDTYLRRMAGLPKAKSMIDILQDDQFFIKIHMWSSFMLGALEKNRHI